ncbi:inovirus-type Gp2 protein [Frateuria sp. GZRR33]|uniref:YagK/YfjJ domain-containing protein n=1 Tax=Frateuria sp. GZRR33 TaxID=3351535 RepID=UPI003EDBB369
MKDKDRLIERQWRASTASWQDGMLIIHHEYDYPREIIEIDSLMREVAKSDEQFFSTELCRWRKRYIVKVTPMGRRLLTCLTFDLRSIAALFSQNKLSPYFTLFSNKVIDTSICKQDLAADTVDAFNSWIRDLRYAARESGFQKSIDDQERAARKNAASLLKYIRELHEMFAKLVVVRLDLGYSKEYREELEDKELNPSTVKKHFKQLLKYLRRKFPTLVGYVWKLEYGTLKSYHYHLMLLFNGHEVRKDVTLGQLVGEHWVNVATEGSGTYWNCNARKDTYSKLGLLGIGTIRYSDTELRAGLEKAALYLAKVDYYVKLNAPDVGRTFGKGALIRRTGARRGRPRTLAAESPAKITLTGPTGSYNGDAQTLTVRGA